MKRVLCFLSLIILVYSGNCFAQEVQESRPQAEETRKSLPITLEQVRELEGKDQPDRFMTELLNMLTTLGLLVALLLGASWFVKRMLNSRIQQVNETSNIKIRESRSISTRTSIHLIEVQGRSFLIAESQNGVTNLGPMETYIKPNEV